MKWAESGTSSKPTTLTSSGTDLPRSWKARRRPSAIWSLAANTAVQLGSSASARPAAYPEAADQSPRTGSGTGSPTSSRVARQVAARRCAANDFAAYLAGATRRLEKEAHKIKADTVAPFNEPNADYWSTRLGSDGQPVGGRQEGAHMGPELQQKVIRALAPELRKSGTRAGISAMDETNPTLFAQNWNAYADDVRALVDRLNVHTYGTEGCSTVRDLAKAAKKPLWMSEVEGEWDPDGQDFTDMRSGLGLAQHMVDDLRELEPSAWVFWQPVEDYDNMKPGGESEKGGNWGSIQLPFDCTAKAPWRPVRSGPTPSSTPPATSPTPSGRATVWSRWTSLRAPRPSAPTGRARP